MSTIDVKDNRKRSMTKIMTLVASKAASNSDSDEYVRLLCKKRIITGALLNHKYQGGNSEASWRSDLLNAFQEGMNA